MLGLRTKKALSKKTNDFLKECNLLKLDYISSDVGIMIDNFIKGEKILTCKLSNYNHEKQPFDFRLAEKLFLQISPFKHYCYDDGIRHIKRVIKDCEQHYSNDVVFFSPTKGYNLTEEDKVLFVRFVNMCIGNKHYIIVYKNSIIYVPDNLKDLSQESIAFHVSKAKKDLPSNKKYFWQ